MTANKFIIFIFIICSAFSVFAQDSSEQQAQNFITAKNFRQARAVYEELYRRNPEKLAYLNWTARLTSWLGEMERANKIYSEVLRIAPNNSEALIGKSYVLMWQKKYKEAAKYLNSAEKIDGDKQAWAIASVNFYRYQGKKTQALKMLVETKKIAPENAEIGELEKSVGEIENSFYETGCSQSTAPFSTSDRSCFASIGTRRAGDEFTFRIEKDSRQTENFIRGGIFWKREIGNKTTVRAGAMFAPRANISTKLDAEIGFDYALSKHIQIGADYRFLRIQNENVQIVSPSLQYVFSPKMLVNITIYKGWQNSAVKSASGAIAFNFERRIYSKLRVGISYAKIRETTLFSDRSALAANRDAYTFNAAYRLNKRFTFAANYGFALAQNESSRRAFGFRLSFNR